MESKNLCSTCKIIFMWLREVVPSLAYQARKNLTKPHTSSFRGPYQPLCNIVLEAHLFRCFSENTCPPGYRNATYFYNMDTNTWNRGPDLSQSRAHHTCNLINHKNGTRDIVIVGGRGTGCTAGTNTVDIIHLDSNWQALRSGNTNSQLTKRWPISQEHHFRCTSSNPCDGPYHGSLRRQNCADGRL